MTTLDHRGVRRFSLEPDGPRTNEVQESTPMKEKGEKRVVRVRRSVRESTNWHVHERVCRASLHPLAGIYRARGELDLST